MPSAPVIGLRSALREAVRTKAGIFGFGMLAIIVGIVVAMPIVAPYDVVSTWTNPEAWTDNPMNAAPDWIDAFSDKKQPRNIIVDWDRWTSSENVSSSGAFKVIILRARWDFSYDAFPQEVRLALLASWADRLPQITVEWERPDDEKLVIWSGSPDIGRRAPLVQTIALSSNRDVQNKVEEWAQRLGANATDDVFPEVTLYAAQDANMLSSSRAQVLKGRYTLWVTAFAFNVTDTIEARFISYGKVFGLAGTDSNRRDLLVGLLWGAPVALAFGVAAATITVLAQVILGALGAYYGGRTDEVIQRATDFFVIIPSLPIFILIGYLYQLSILHILLLVVVFNIVGGTTKVVRSIVLQAKEEMYVEAARSYGASRARILFRYIMPRTLPYAFALLALSVPTFIFLEASLSFLGVGDPVLPTWGAIMGDASRGGAMYNGLWWWIAFPALGIVFVTIAFAFLGYAFDQILNPRLREE